MQNAGPASNQSFTKIIGDLEDMLNQALEIAGRAVKDSSSALDERDASIRSLRNSTRTSLLSIPEEELEAKRASPEPEFVSARVSPVPRTASVPLEPPRIPYAEPITNPKISSNTAVYSDDGEPTSKSDLTPVPYDKKEKQKAKPSAPVMDIEESERERSWHRHMPDDSYAQVTATAMTRRFDNPTEQTLNTQIPPVGPGRYRMEVGKDGEIILVRMAPPRFSIETGQRLPPDEPNEPIPHQYRGGWEWSL